MEDSSSKRKSTKQPKQASKRAKSIDEPKQLPSNPNRTNQNWCFTLNNYTEDEETFIKALISNPKNRVQYIVFGHETGKNGTPHLQGFVQFDCRRNFAVVQRLFNLPRVHLEPKIPQSTPLQAADYCKKDGDYFERGALDNDTFQGQGKRNDILEARNAVRDGASALQLMDSDEHVGAAIKYFRSFQAYEAFKVSGRTHKTRCIVFFGDPGTYKSLAAATYKDSYTVVRPRTKFDGAWFDGYAPQSHSTVLFDDFYGWMPFNQLLELCDRYPCQVQVKGGTAQYRPKANVFTSNANPDEWYKYTDTMRYDALERRLDAVYRHTRVQARFDDEPAVEIGDIVIMVIKGAMSWHPLWQFCTPLENHDSWFKLHPEEVYRILPSEPTVEEMKQELTSLWQINLASDEAALDDGSSSSHVIELSDADIIDIDSMEQPEGLESEEMAESSFDSSESSDDSSDVSD